MTGLTGNNAITGAGYKTNQPSYEIDQSLRFEDGDSAYLNRTPSGAGNRKAWTLSVWVKLGGPDGLDHAILDAWQDGSNIADLSISGEEVNFHLYQGGSHVARKATTRLLRDPSSWYHIVYVWDSANSTAGDRMKIYVNGERQTDFRVSIDPSQDLDSVVNNAVAHNIGRQNDGSEYWNGYMAEYHFIDGQALTPASFGETNSATNQWVPIEVTGMTYGTNGFYLKFQDSSALGDDSSGNTNDFTSTNLAATDQVLDSPTNNFCTINALTESITNRNDFSEGNLRATANDISGNSSAWFTATMGIPPNTGKWYWEFADEIYIDAGSFGGSYPDGWGMGLLADDGHAKLFADNDISNTGWWFSKSNDNVGTARARGGSTSSENKRVPSTSTGVFKCCYDSDAGSFWFGGDLGWMTKTSTGTPETSDQPGSGNDLWDSGTGVGFSGYTVIPAWATINAGGNLTQLRFNFGQDSTFAGIRSGVSGTAGNPSGGGYGGNTDANGYGDFFYEVPTGFKALCSDNLPDPSIADPTKHFDTTLVSGNGSNRSITGLNFQPNFLWGKSRTNTLDHYLTDSVRGVTKQLYSNRYIAENSETVIYTAFNSDGFSLGTGDMNLSGQNYVHWAWKGGGSASNNDEGSITSSVSANTTAGFSIVGWAGTGSNVTVGHGLSQAPDLIINKSRTLNTSSSQWVVQSILWNSASDTNMLYLNGTGAASDDTNVFQAAPTSTVFSPQGGGWAGIGASGEDYIAYCFHSVEGYSKIGTYQGNGNNDGPFIYTGFQPAFFLVKKYATVGGDNWAIYDNKRNEANVMNTQIYPDANSTEESSAARNIDFVSNGIKIRGTNARTNDSSSHSFLYMAFAEFPFKTSNAR